jgi:pyridoxamine 5'-phosphate oxidase
MSNTRKLFELRKEYTQGGISLKQVLPDPIAQFNLWFEQAVFGGIIEPNAMTLATASKNGKVSARTVLLKEVDTEGFVFFTNYTSYKAKHLAENPFASLVFLWLDLERQVRIEGLVSKIDEQESETYFNSRPRESQLGAWASDQSSVIDSRELLHQRYSELEKQFENKPVPRPSFWGGYRLIPNEIEFWQGRPGRLHDRILYSKINEIWERKRLAP